MKAKLIKHTEPDFYFISNGDGSTFATTDDWHLKHLKCFKLSLKNCQAIERGYDLDELAWNHAFNFYEKEDRFNGEQSFKEGFQKALELMADKKFSEEQLKIAADWYFETKGKKSIDEYIQSLQPTEWEVDIEVTGIDCGINDEGQRLINVEPKLDADGCLILKRI